MKTSKIYFEKEQTESREYIKSIYTIPNDLQLVNISLNPEQSYSSYDNSKSVFIMINSGNGKITINYPNKYENVNIETNNSLIIPNGIKWTLSATTFLSAKLLFSGQVYPSDYIQTTILAKMKGGKEEIMKIYGDQLKKILIRDSLSISVENLIDLIIDADPSQDGKYTEWIITNYINDWIKYQEISNVKPALIDFLILFNNDKLSLGIIDSKTGKINPWTIETNINNYCGLIGCTVKKFKKIGLNDILNKNVTFLNEYKKEKQEEEIAKSSTRLVFENELVKVYQPLTTESACKYGQGTKWCTAATTSENRYNEYSQSGPMFIIIPKNPKYLGEKYQYLHNKEQYTNEENISVDRKELFTKFKMYHELNPIKSIDINTKNDFEEISTNLYKYNNIETLSIHQNLDEIPEFVYNLYSLKFLHLSYNKLSKISYNISNLLHLVHFSLSYNNFTEIPESISTLTNLSRLWLSHNKITKIPEFILKLTNLEELSLIDNKITDVPEFLVNIPPKLRKLTLMDNPIKTISPKLEPLIEKHRILIVDDEIGFGYR